MAKLGLVLDHLRKLLHRDTASSDWELLRRFTEDKDEAAFSCLIERYGRMVMGTAFRVLQNEHDAADVFQATFGMLVRKANSLSPTGSFSTWLHTVAFNLALNAKKRNTMRREREKEAASMAELQTSADAWEEIRPLLDAELEQLPATYRLPLTLTYLMGKTTEEAAQEIGCSPDAVRGRLARGRELLRNRLVKKGVTISSILLTTALVENAADASVSVACAASALQVALVVAGQGTSVLSPTVSALIQEGVRQMFFSKLKFLAVVLVAVLVFGGGVGMVMSQLSSGTNDAAKKAEDDKPDDVRIQGTWRLVAAEGEGERIEVPSDPNQAANILVVYAGGGIIWKFQGDKLIARGGAAFQEATFTLTSGQVNEMDLKLTKGGIEGQTARAIYALDGNDLKICADVVDFTKRPNGFKTRPGSSWIVHHFKRENRDEPKKNAPKDKDATNEEPKQDKGKEKPKIDKGKLIGVWEHKTNGVIMVEGFILTIEFTKDGKFKFKEQGGGLTNKDLEGTYELKEDNLAFTVEKGGDKMNIGDSIKSLDDNKFVILVETRTGKREATFVRKKEEGKDKEKKGKQ